MDALKIKNITPNIQNPQTGYSEIGRVFSIEVVICGIIKIFFPVGRIIYKPQLKFI